MNSPWSFPRQLQLCTGQLELLASMNSIWCQESSIPRDSLRQLKLFLFTWQSPVYTQDRQEVQNGIEFMVNWKKQIVHNQQKMFCGVSFNPDEQVIKDHQTLSKRLDSSNDHYPTQQKLLDYLSHSLFKQTAACVTILRKLFGDNGLHCLFQGNTMVISQNLSTR